MANRPQSRERFLGWDLRRHEGIDSTNAEVKRLLEAGEPEGIAVTALKQTGGYGRQGRLWKSPLGGMYLSVLLRPQVPAVRLPTLSLVAAVAVRRTCSELLADAPMANSVQVKWPNDVVVSRAAYPQDAADGKLRKLCGISLESHGGGLCLGIGINVCRPLPDGQDAAEAAASPTRNAGASCISGDAASVDAGRSIRAPSVCEAIDRSDRSVAFEGVARAARPAFPSAVLPGKNRPAYLSDLNPGLAGNHGSDDGGEAAVHTAIAGAVSSVLAHLGEAYPLWCAEGLCPFLEEYRSHQAMLGDKVVIEDRNGAVMAQGAVAGINGEGCLLLCDDEGRLHSVVSGEAHLR